MSACVQGGSKRWCLTTQIHCANLEKMYKENKQEVI